MKFDGEHPVWEDGDVVVVRFVRKRKPNEKDGEMLSDPYTYTRKAGFWPGDGGFWSDHTDYTMTTAWHEFRLQMMEMTAAPDMPMDLGQESRLLVDLRILQRRLRSVQDIIESTSQDRPLSSFIRELEDVLG